MSVPEQQDDQYAAIAEAFSRLDNLPIRTLAEVPTFLAALGPLDGATVLDLASGTGFYSRLLAQHGARSVTGVDVSAAMVDSARARTAPTEPIDYLCHDLAEPLSLGQFDVVTASFLLNYAATREELAGMCDNIVRHLRPGGRFVGNLLDSDYYRRPPFDTRYGIGLPWGGEDGEGGELAEGDELRFELHLDPTISATCYYWTNDTYRGALERAGLREVRFQPWRPSQAGVDALGSEFWQPWLDNTSHVVVTGRVPPA